MYVHFDSGENLRGRFTALSEIILKLFLFLQVYHGGNLGWLLVCYLAQHRGQHGWVIPGSLCSCTGCAESALCHHWCWVFWSF